MEFTGYKDGKHIRIAMDKNQVELINECQGIMEVYEHYKEMEYFPEAEGMAGEVW